jgi:hypothetical protein
MQRKSLFEADTRYMALASRRRKLGERGDYSKGRKNDEVLMAVEVWSACGSVGMILISALMGPSIGRLGSSRGIFLVRSDQRSSLRPSSIYYILPATFFSPPCLPCQ